MPNSVIVEEKNIQAIENHEKEAIKNLLADHLLNFYYEYSSFAGLNYQSKREAFANYSTFGSEVFFTSCASSALAGVGLGAIIGGLPGAVLFGFMGAFLGAQLSLLFLLLGAAFIATHALLTESSLAAKKNIGERLQQISPLEAPTKMKEIANDLVENQLMKENINLNQISLYQIASHAIAGLKTPRENEDIKTAMLRGAQEKKALFSFPQNIWFWIKSLFIKSDQAFQLKKYSDTELNKPAIQNNNYSSNPFFDIPFPPSNSTNPGLTFFPSSESNSNGVVIDSSYRPNPFSSNSSV